jgi:intraflagellar transport protein 81
MNLSNVAFDEKSPFELLEVMNAIFAHLSKDHAVDLRDETPDSTATRMVDFLRVLNFKQALDVQDFKRGLLHGDPGVIYPILVWMLQRLPELQKRAYLAKFLVNVDVPEHMFSDEEICEVYQQYQDLQGEFKEAHKAAEKFKSQLISPDEIKKAILQMEEDKRQLESKVESLRGKLGGTDNFDGMLAACQKLRLEQDEQVKLQDRFKEQQAQLIGAEQTFERIAAQEQERRALVSSSSSPEKLKAAVAALEEQCRELERRCEHDLPRAIHERQQELESLQMLINEPLPDDHEMMQLGAERAALLQAVGELEEQKRRKESDPDDKLAMFRQQANLVSKKKEAVQQRLRMALADKESVDRQLAAKAEQFESVKGQAPVLKGEEFRKYATELRGKTAQYKRMKAELAELRSEWGVLSRTEAVLRNQAGEAAKALGEKEKAAGVEGFQAAQEQLEMVSEQKAEVDEVKGKTLEEISAVVEQINTQITSRKQKLAPQIKELRTLRTKFQELETEYLEKKGLYDNQNAGLESEIAKLKAEVDAEEKACVDEERAAATHTSLSSIIEVKLKRAEAERGGTFRRTMPDGAVVTSYKELYNSKIRQQQVEVKELRERQQHLKENVGPHRHQMGMFRDLHKLLRCKLEMQERDRREASRMAAEEGADTNVWTAGPEG